MGEHEVFLVGQWVIVVSTGSYGVIRGLIGQSTLIVTVEDGPTLRFDRSQIELLPGNFVPRKAGI